MSVDISHAEVGLAPHHLISFIQADFIYAKRGSSHKSLLFYRYGMSIGLAYFSLLFFSLVISNEIIAAFKIRRLTISMSCQLAADIII